MVEFFLNRLIIEKDSLDRGRLCSKLILPTSSLIYFTLCHIIPVVTLPTEQMMLMAHQLI